MATRAVIQIEGIDFAQIYKHWDGYPAGMLDWLEDFNRDFVEDPSYKFAQVLRFAKEHAKKYNIDPSLNSGWGVVEFNADCDEDYVYVLKRNGTVLTKTV